MMTAQNGTPPARPRSLTILNSEMNDIFCGKSATDPLSVRNAAAIDIEAGDYDIGYRFGTMMEPVFKEKDVLMRCSIFAGQGNRPNDHQNEKDVREVHPVLASYFERFKVIDSLARKLRECDTEGKWEDAEAIAESLCEVLANRLKRVDRKPQNKRRWVPRGRLRLANPALDEKLKDADRDAQEYEQGLTSTLDLETNA